MALIQKKQSHVGNCIDYSEVINSRKRDSWVWRRRVCKLCGRTFSTIEVEGPIAENQSHIALALITIIKSTWPDKY